MAGKRGAVEAARAPPRWPGRDDDDSDGVGDGRGVSLVQALSAARRETEAAGARMAAAVQQGQAAWRSGRRAEASEHRDVKLTASAEREAWAAAQVRLLLRLAGGGDTLDVHHAHVEPALVALRRWLACPARWPPMAAWWWPPAVATTPQPRGPASSRACCGRCRRRGCGARRSAAAGPWRSTTDTPRSTAANIVKDPGANAA